MISSEVIRTRITADALALRALHDKVHTTSMLRDQDACARELWVEATREFRDKYDLLAFPGGESTMKRRLFAGDPETVECALCFLEVRPYFFRSGYMFKDLIRWCRKISLTAEQRARFNAVESTYKAWRKRSRDEMDT